MAAFLESESLVLPGGAGTLARMNHRGPGRPPIGCSDCFQKGPSDEAATKVLGTQKFASMAILAPSGTSFGMTRCARIA
ncbi:hypothetical protein N234_22262 [Ralstonia pickettii DTP0602]|nr:hypothetical protein N234_22262 [Ralstonia pickettii DTP0602]